jgi:hypothetical protein
MKHLKFFLAFTVFLFLGINLSYAQEDWIKFKGEGDLAFSVDAPASLIKSLKTLTTAVGDLEVLTYEYQGEEEDANYLYLINMVQYPEGTFPPDSTELIVDYLTNAIESSAENVKGELIYSTPIDNKFGKLFRIKYNGGEAIIKGKVFIRKDVFVSIQVFTISSKSLNNEMDIFLDSFRMGF